MKRILTFIAGCLFLVSCQKDDTLLDSSIAPLASSKKAKVTGKVKDVDGNWYNTVTIGTQVWMAENLKTTRLNDKTEITFITDNEAWATTTEAAMCWYENNQASYKDLYGGLYNWYVVNTGKLCPNGWHVPTDAEWRVLVDNQGGPLVAGTKLRSTGTLEGEDGLWYGPNNATNSSGFTALPAGGRVADEGYHGVFLTQGISAYFWTSSLDGSEWPIYWWLWGQTDEAWSANFFKQTGFTVRCLKDK